MTSSDYRRLLPALFALAVVALPAHAQSPVSRVCVQLEAQLAAFDRGAADPARAEQIRRFEDAAHKQQFELDRVTANARRTGCEGTGFFLFGGQPAQCGPINTQIQQMRANLARIQSDLAQLQGGSGPDREAQRAAVLASLAENDCGPQYRAAAAPRRGGLFEALFGPSNIFTAPAENTQSGTYRTVCVRTCDGYFYPISFSTVPGKFRDDERVCQRSCPAAEVALYSHRNPGEDMNQAVSLNTQQPYTALPTAFRYRQSFDAACSCRRAGETWAQALKHVEDQTVERGDIVVNEQRARQMSQPRLDAQGKPIRPEPRSTPAPASPAAAATTSPTEAPAEPNPKRTVRSVGPAFYPTR